MANLAQGLSAPPARVLDLTVAPPVVRAAPPAPLALQSFDPASQLPSAATLNRQRIFDVVVGAVLATVALPIVLVLAVACMLTLRAAPLFIHSRPGRRDRDLRVVKLRTLPRSYPKWGLKPELAGAKVPALTACLRRLHLDELPQLFEVVCGRMSLVGPRPRQHDEIDMLHPEFDHIRREVRQGCTGLWQISVAADGHLSDAVDYDLFYLRHMSLRMDVWILLRTFGRLLGLAKPVELSDIPEWALRREPAWALTPYPRSESMSPAMADDLAI